MGETISHSFSAPMGRSTIQMTLFAAIVLLFAGGLPLFLGLKRENGGRRVLIYSGLIVLLCLPATVFLKVRDYEVTASEVVVRYGFMTRSFPLAQIEEVTHQPNALRGARRDAGNGGMWSFLGWFSNRELGKIRAYVSDLDRTVVLKMPKYNLVVSPSAPAEFVQAVQKQKGAARG
jgi:hypothetical protein